MIGLIALFITALGNNDNCSPVIDYLTSDKASPQETGAVITWSANATDPDGDPVQYRFFLDDEPVTEWTTERTWIWTTNEIDVGSNRIEVQVRDGKHASPSGLDDMRSAEFTLNAQAVAVESSVFEQVTLILFIKNGYKSGPVIPGTQVSGQDGSGNSFQETTDSNGVAIINGDPGNWSFTAFAEGYETNSWSMQINDTLTKDAILQKIQVRQEPAKITITLQFHEGSSSGPILSGVQVIVQDGSDNMFHETADSNGIVTTTGDPGNWSLTASEEGYEDKSWSQQRTDSSITHAFLQKMQSQINVYAKPNQLSGSLPEDYASI